MNYRWLASLAMLLPGLLLLPALVAPDATTQAQANERCFAETNECISGPIRSYWEGNGGLPVFGYPITPQRVETVEGRVLQVQWFQRDRLEIQRDGTVTAGRLGARVLELRGTPWETFEKVSAAEAPTACRYFVETNHTMCEPFLSYWQDNGGLERFGFPITEPLIERLEGQEYTVQYYERRRMEIHPELPGSPVLLGLLGTRVLFLEENPAPGATSTSTPGPTSTSTTTPTPSTTPSPTPTGTPTCTADVIESLRASYLIVRFREELGCPTGEFRKDIPAAVQNFESGQMIWVDPTVRRPETAPLPRTIFAIINRDQTFKQYVDDWQEGVDPEVPDIEPPREGLYTPRRGFGKVWRNDSTLRNAIGFAVEPRESEDRADIQTFEGGVMFYLYDVGLVYAFGTPENPQQVHVIIP
jgi:hypothetical protein